MVHNHHPDAPTDDEGYPIHPQHGYRICGCKKSEESDNTNDEYPFCMHPSAYDVDGKDEGPCTYHGGSSDGPPENNGNRETHGMSSDGRKWFERHRAEAQEDVRRMVAGWMKRAPFGWENYGNVQLLVDAAINECQVRRGDEYIREEGMIVEDFDGVAQDGREIHERKENPALMAKSRLQRDTVRILEKLGVLESDDDTTVNVNVHEEILDGLKAAHED